MEIYLVRHTSVGVEKTLCYGHLDVPLSDNYESEKIAIQAKIPNTFDVVYSSPLSRCSILAEDLSDTKTVQDMRLLEVGFGEWEGKKWDDIDQNELNSWMLDFANINPPGGESANDLLNRMRSFVKDLRNENFDSCLIVAHAGSIRALLCVILGYKAENMFKVHIHHGTVVHLKLGSTPWEDTLLKIY